LIENWLRTLITMSKLVDNLCKTGRSRFSSGLEEMAEGARATTHDEEGVERCASLLLRSFFLPLEAKEGRDLW